jgi:hypothetical protein
VRVDRLASGLPTLVGALRRHGELDIDDTTAGLLCAMSAATIDRRLTDDRKRLQLKGRSHTKPGSLLKSQIPMRTWAQWDENTPGSWRSTWSGTRAATPTASSPGR